ncbi:hypothetical protein AXG93_1731s1000 [Marchantia polymorpha subsp. ruderalis]|uniref:CAF-1 p60 homolog n=1 Tax=Marchantia polymorpha subsp. ruderalis TaxID=1480154 RepID=A0A176VW78_MARPO|nr:hypothetical protein AXG93_1731s1000 [Marchantia polymorpha subsp. ruderalis]
MKGGTVQISWHGSDPILSVDFHPTSGLLATAGADRDIKLWSLNHVEKSKVLPTACFKTSLSYHSSAVNVVRFSPSGELLASGADGGELVIWRLVAVGEEIPTWKVWKTLRFHLKDVLDLEWAMDGAYLVSASVDNTCIIWDVTRGAVQQVLSDHQHYVQGVTWDPVGEYVVSLSGDRTCRFYSARPSTKKLKGKEKKEDKLRKAFECKHVLFKRDATAVVSCKGDDLQKQVPATKQYLFYDENMPSFFRRLSWSPDGSFLVVPSGVEKQSPEAAPCSLTYLVSRKELTKSCPQPTMQLPAGSKPVMGVRFCPVYFSLRTEKLQKPEMNSSELGCIDLPYRLVFAVATLSCVFIYDTQESCPIAIFSGLHYAPITDLAWSPDARFLAVSSQDGYCTLVGFDEGELGLPLPLEECRIQQKFAPTAVPLSAMSSPPPLTEGMIPSVIDQTTPTPVTPGYVNRNGIITPTEVSKVVNSGKQRSETVKMRRVTPKAITDILGAVPASVSPSNSDAAINGSLAEQSCQPDHGAVGSSRSQLPTESEESPSVIILKGLVGYQSSSLCREDQVMTVQGPATPLSNKQVENSDLEGTPKPSEQFAHIYVRPLKFRRITPKPVVDEMSPVASKPLTC